MADAPALTPEKREGFLGEFGMKPTQEYQIGTPEEGAVAEDPVEAQGAEEAAVEPQAAEGPDRTEIEPQVEETPVETAPAEPEAPVEEEQSDLDYLNSLVAPAEEPAPTTNAGLDLAQVQKLLELSRGRIEGAREEPVVAEPAGEALDLEAMDWMATGVQEQLESRLRNAGQDPALAGVLGGVLNDFNQVISNNVMKPGIGKVEAKFEEREQKRKLEAEYRASWNNLGTVPATILEKYPGTMEASIAQQYAQGLQGALSEMGDTTEARAEGLSRSLLGREVLKNPQLALTQEGVMRTVLAVAGGARLHRRGGKPETLMTGTKEEVSGALAKAHGVTPSTDGKESELSPEDQILADMDQAAQTNRVSVGKNVFFQN